MMAGDDRNENKRKTQYQVTISDQSAGLKTLQYDDIQVGDEVTQIGRAHV
mgnify:CR=1 FL=1